MSARGQPDPAKAVGIALPDARFNGGVRRVAVSGGSLIVESVGEGATLVFVHGWTLDRRVWAPQVAALSGRSRVVSYDRRGFGQSDAPPSLIDEPGDLLALLDDLAIERATLIAMSQGTRVALAFATLHPERVAALVLQGPSPTICGALAEADDEQVPYAAMADLARQGRWPDLQAVWSAHPLLDLPGGEGSDLLGAIVREYRARDLLAPGAPLEVSWADLGRVACLVLFLGGDHDSSARRRIVASLVQALPDARSEEVSGGGHLCNLCSPDAYNAALTRFLDDVARN